ncbi:MAG: PE-PGRS family protein [Cytophagales bacterium]|nr:PE-PGRS family protein [Cytophagales bacterium]
MLRGLIAILVVLSCQSCFLFTDDPGPDPVNVDPLPEFLSTPSSYIIAKGPIDEGSGMVASQSMPGNLWVITDGNTSAKLHLISNIGAYLGAIDLWPATNRDWEDIADGPGPEEGVNYLYIADTGDNAENYGTYKIVRMKEPSGITDGLQTDIISFKYEDKSGLDVEAMFVDPATKDIYLVSKRQLFAVRLYKLTYPYSTEVENVATFQGSIPLNFITAADISKDGKQIMLKNYDAVYYWRLKENETIPEALSRSRDVGAPYFVEPQGESLCFDNKDSGYYTLSERAYNEPEVSLYYYQRKTEE